jgi:hypothetical protein
MIARLNFSRPETQPYLIFLPQGLASSLFRPRRFTQVDGGVFLLGE